MPGYEKERFVSIGESERNELSCGICHEILKEPVVANCCLQTFCRECITQWLTNDSSCPYDRKPMTSNDMNPAPSRADE
ncbi:unnamed protein product [Oppiella nova]|uniref:RING-type domain-containing protein n=1 Tax=Oppiella nova TaxID=334625 RepID=A0A7R9M4I8_9ACAR|nr:unnamed protein product [Oppiella nova]CAG2169305.1 unnamed protein product [Oppiella nova]